MPPPTEKWICDVCGGRGGFCTNCDGRGYVTDYKPDNAVPWEKTTAMPPPTDQLLTASERKALTRWAGEVGYTDFAKYERTVVALCKSLRELIQDTEHRDHNCGDMNCPVAMAQAILARVDGGEES